MTYDELLELLYRLIDCVKFTKEISGLSDCNDCGWKGNCKYEPKIGQITRINCPLWKERKEKL